MYLNALYPMAPADDQLIIMFLSSISLVTLVSVLAACLCCKRRNPKSELAGIEGIVKLKHLDESSLQVSIDTTDSSDALNPKTRLAQKNATLPLDAKMNGFHDNDLKRSSANAPHRSLPDIPIIETVCDNNSELYATVGDKLQDKNQSKSPLNTKKLANISQHSSMSQADDVSSPYARVRSPAHAYDRLKKTEHPYAQVVQQANGGIAQVVLENDDDEDEDETTIENPISHRESSNHDLLSTGSAAIDASAAISGRISASQELPYMTPPIQQQQHFSGDSQDSSKGYQMISVREPLANIIAQTNQQNANRRKDIQDSHYATVSDDSEEETYAAIEEPNAGELYTSGSETYAQIQAPMTVSVEINATAPQQASTSSSRFNRMSSSNHSAVHPIEEAPVEALKNLHSRQASSSSCTNSSVGSPKPEKKRQANSPLPPTPKASRNSTSSILEYHEGAKIKDSNNNPNKVKQSPSKDLEGMYAKVMKKNKLSSVPSENSSPVLPWHDPPTTNDVTQTTEILFKVGNEYETIDKKRNRTRNTELNDAGYETIPADRNNNKDDDSTTTTPHYAQISETREKPSKAKVSLFPEPAQLDSIDDPKYEVLVKVEKKEESSSDYDPNYEIVNNPQEKALSSSSSTLVEEGYSQIDKKLKDFSDDDESIPGYSTIKKVEPTANSIKSDDSNIYSSIPAVAVTPSTDSNSSRLDYTVNNNYETLSNSESTALDEPNYESMKYLKENPYERLHNEKSPVGDDEPASESKSSTSGAAAVDDFFKV